jgi:hypothetical protein
MESGAIRMTATVAGIYRGGRIELLGTPSGVREGPVLVTVQEMTERTPEPQLLPYGKYSEGRESTKEDFEITEWREETNNALSRLLD